MRNIGKENYNIEDKRDRKKKYNYSNRGGQLKTCVIITAVMQCLGTTKLVLI